MSSRKALVGTVAGCVAAMAFMASPAFAVKTTDQFSLKGSHKYTISAIGSKTAEGTATSLTASKGSGSATYSHRGRATAHVLKFKLGHFGKVATRFHLRKTVHRAPPPYCTGRKQKVEKGTFKGTIKFKGEGGYTKVNARKAKGTVSFPAHFHCHGGGGGNTHGTLLQSFNGPSNFTARKSNGSSRAEFSAFTSNTSGSVSIFRFVTRNGPGSDFTFDNGLTTADVSPPGAFSGSGHYSSGNLSGNLKASFPGKKNVSLTGSATLTSF